MFLAKISQEWPLAQLLLSLCFQSRASAGHVALSTTVFQSPTRIFPYALLTVFNRFSSPKSKSFPDSYKIHIDKSVAAVAHSLIPTSVLIAFYFYDKTLWPKSNTGREPFSLVHGNHSLSWRETGAETQKRWKPWRTGTVRTGLLLIACPTCYLKPFRTTYPDVACELSPLTLNISQENVSQAYTQANVGRSFS